MIKKMIVIFLILLSYCNSNDPDKTQLSEVTNIFDFYRKYSIYTNPGKYKYMYEVLPDSLTKLCELIKCQFIHPVDLNPYRKIIPPNRYYEDPKFPTVEKLLVGLLNLDANGLTFDRIPENRLIVTCRYHSIFLASILKFRGIPTRVRYGFAPYLSSKKDLHICHVICEVWNDRTKRWMFVDPDRRMVDFPKHEFELAGDVWLQYQNNEIEEPEKYGVARTWGDFNILDMLCHDLASLLGYELLYWERPPISQNESMNVRKLEKEKIELLNEISRLMKNPDVHLNELFVIYEKNKFLKYNK